MDPMSARKPIGSLTRGTTAPNRLRRIDRWLAAAAPARLVRSAADPLVVDLGFGSSPVTTIELARRLRRVRAGVEVVGIEIDPGRVLLARQLAEQLGADIGFARGGFELSPVSGRAPVIVRAANVWRQYPADEVAAGWAEVTSRLAPAGILVDATCDEIGRLSSWLVVSGTPPQPVCLTISLRLRGLESPAVVAERLPKVLIHRNTPGERVHDYLQALDQNWRRAAPMADFGVRQRFIRTCQTLQSDGWPLLDGPSRWRLGELSVAWEAVRPT